jgi:tetratricopeptide (TPR) repeat protein
MDSYRLTTRMMRDRILRWERLTRQSWDEAKSRYAALAAKYGISVRELNPDDPKFSILERADHGKKLYPEDFKIMEIYGVQDFESKLRLVKEKCAKWEQATGKNWDEAQAKFMRLAARYRANVQDFSPTNPLFRILQCCESGVELDFHEDQLLARAAGSRAANYCSNLRKRILAWEISTGEDWESASTQFAQLSRWYDVQVDDFSPDNPLFAVLRRVDDGYPLDANDRHLLAEFGGPSLVTRLVHQKSVAEWEQRTGQSWSDEIAVFQRLCRKYNIPDQEVFPDDPILRILEQLDSGEELSDSDLNTVAACGAPELATTYHKLKVFETRYQESGQPEVLAKISSLWNNCGVPALALEATDRVIGPDHVPLIPLSTYTEAILLTTRGASLRRLNRLIEARTCAERAIQLRVNDGHAYCLLGAIDLQEGDVANGERNFSECERLQPQSEADNWRRGALKSAMHPADYAAYLLNKDPERFHWAGNYLRGSRRFQDNTFPF